MKKNILTTLSLLCVAVAGFAIGSTFPYYHQRWLGTGTTRNTEQFSIQTPSAGASAIFVPGVTNTNALGSTALRFSNVFTTLLNVSGAITASGGIVGSAPFRVPTLDVTVSSPSANVGDLAVTSAGVLYASTNTAAAITSWAKVGAQ